MSKETVVVWLDQAARTARGKDAFPFDRVTGVEVVKREPMERVTLRLDRDARIAAGKNPFPFSDGYMTGVTVAEAAHEDDEQPESRTFTFMVTITARADEMPENGDLSDMVNDHFDVEDVSVN